MLRKPVVGMLAVVVGTIGLSCAVPPPPVDGGNGSGGSGTGGSGTEGGNGSDGGGVTANPLGALTITSARTFSSSGTQNTLEAAALFATIEPVDPDAVSSTTIGDCVITTLSVDPNDLPTTPTPPNPLDPGLSGTLSTASATASLDKQIEGLYATAELSDAGFTTGETYTFEFEGGTDIAGFMTSIDLPGSFTATTPDLTDDALTVDKTNALDVTWTPSGSTSSVSVGVSTADVSTFVSIECTFDDTGSATVPQAAMALLLDQPVSTSVSIGRTNTNEITVDLVDGTTGTLMITARTDDTRTIIGAVDSGGVDPCMFIQPNCPEGTTCNPATFLCE